MEQQVKLRHREAGFAGRHSHNIAYQIWTPHAHVLALKNKDFSRDPAVVATMNADPLIANETQPTKTVAEMVRADERLKREFPQITLPVLTLHGRKKVVTKPSGSEYFHGHAGSADRMLKLYEGHVHDLNCGSHCPLGGAFFDGRSKRLTADLWTHCLLIEILEGLVLVDTGCGAHDMQHARPGRLPRLWSTILNIRYCVEDAAAWQIQSLGYPARDVRHIVLTHLDFDHAGGIADFRGRAFMS